MEVILLEKIDKVGSIGDRVKVKSGYARNYLIPKGKATLATAENIAKFEELRADLEAKAVAEAEAARARAAQLEGKALRMTAQAGSEGKLFGSIGTIDIAEACAELGVEVERSEVRMADGPLRMLGEHTVELHFHADVDVALTVIVVASDESVDVLGAADEPRDEDEDEN